MIKNNMKIRVDKESEIMKLNGFAQTLRKDVLNMVKKAMTTDNVSLL